MKTKYIFTTLLLLGVQSISQGGSRLDDFDNAKTAFAAKSECTNPKVLGASYDHGDLANCVMGDSRTVVYELEKSRKDEQVQRAKITWFDFAVQNPTGVRQYTPHGDRSDAERYLGVFLETYAPCRKAEVEANFFGGKGCECDIQDGAYKISVQQFDNPSLTERTVEIRPNRP